MKTKSFLKSQAQPCRQRRLLNVLAGMMLAVLGTASAATDTWTGPDNGNWNDGANWLSGSAPSIGDSLVFTNQTGSPETATNDFAGGTAFDGITFGASSAGSTFTLVGDGVLLSGQTTTTIGITNTTSLAETVSNNLALDWGYYTFYSPAGSLNLNGILTANLGGLADFGSSNVKSASFALDGTGLIAGLGGAGMIGQNATANTLGGFTGLATISGGTVSPYAYGGSAIISAAGAIGATTQANATNLELTTTSAGNYSLAGGTSTTFGNSQTFINTVLLTISGTTKITTLDVPSGTGTLVLGTTNAGTGMYVGGIYLPGGQTVQEITIGGSTTQCYLTAGPMSGNSVPGEIIFGINGDNTSNEGELNAMIKDNSSGGKVTVVKTGTGSMYINTINNTYTGGTYVDQGYLQMNGVNDLGTGPVYISSGATLLLPSTGTTVANNFFLSPGAGASYSTAELLDRDGDTVSGTITLLGNPVSAMPGDRVAVNASGKTLTFSGQIAGGGTLDLRGVNTTTTFSINNGIGSANNWTGGMIVSVAAAGDSTDVQNRTPGTFTGNLLLVGSGGAGSITYDLWDQNESIGGLNSSGTGTINIQTGNGATLTVGNNNANGAFSGAIINKVAITKVGSGTQTIIGANTYTGSTTVNQGTLITTTASTGAGSYTVTNGTTLGVQVAGAGQQLNMSSLALGNDVSDTSTVLIKTLATGNPSAAPVNITGALTTFGTVNIQLSGSALATGTFPLIAYGGGETLNGATINLITSSRVSASLSDNGSGLISVTITTIDPSIEWLGGVSGSWDINDTGNTIWQGINSHDATYYIENAGGNDAVTFDDNATGTTTVNLTTTLTPLALTVNNTLSNYVFSGTGNITGAASLTKAGTGSLTLTESGGDNFSGGISIGANGGTVILDNAGSVISGNTTIGSGSALQIGNNDANGNLPGTVTDNGALILDRNDTSLSVGAVITGSGTVTNNGSGTVTLSASPSTFNGSTVINAGILQFSSANSGNGCLENSAIIVNSGGELDLNASDALGYSVSQPITISGTVKKLNSQSETLFRPVTMSGGTLTSVNAVEQFNFFGNYIDSAAGTANNISGTGSFGLRTASCYFTNEPNSTLTISCVIDQNTAGAPLNQFGPGTLVLSAANTYTGATAINGGTLAITGSGSLGGGSYAALITNNGTFYYDSSAGQTLSGVISGTGNLIKDNTSGLTLGAANTFVGSIFITNGTVRANTAGAFNNNPITETADGTTVYFAAGSATYSDDLSIIGYGVAESDNLTHLGGIRMAAAGITLSGTITLTGDAGITSRGSGATGDTIAGQITGPCNIRLNHTSTTTSASTGTIILSNVTANANNWTGNTTNDDGTLKLGASGQIPNGAGYGDFIMTTPGAAFSSGTIAPTVFDLDGNNQTVNGLSSDPGVNGADLDLLVITNSAVTAATLTIGAGDSNGIYAGLIVGGNNLGLTKAGGGTETLSGANTYAGDTAINAGTLALSGTGSIAGSPEVAIAGGATFDVSGLSSTFTLGSSQTLAASGAASAATINGPADAGSGSLSLVNDASHPSLTVANGVLTLNDNSFTINNASGSALIPGTYPLISSGSGGSVAGSVSSSAINVTGSGVVGSHQTSLTSDGSTVSLVIGNRAPVAGPAFTVEVEMGAPSIIQIVGGKYAPTDADGDALTIASVSAPANGTVTFDGTNITYTATNGVSDSFTYTVSDGYGNTSSPATVSVDISAAGQGQNQLSAVMAGGQEVLNYAGIPGFNYALDETHDLTPPVVWTAIVTNTAADNGSLSYTNTPSGGNDYYRTRYVAP